MLQQFEKIYPDNPQIMLKAVASLFPMFSNKISFSSDFKTTAEIHQAMQIASQNKFDLYFSLSLEEIKISRKEIDESLFKMEEEELRSYINLLNERELFGDYLIEIKHNLSRIPENRIELILSVLAFESGRIGDKEARLIGIDSDRISIYIISDFLFRINDESFRYNIISNMLSNTDFLSFQFLLHLLHIIELTHGRVVESSYMQNPKLVNIESLYKLEKIFLERTKRFVVDTNLLDWEESRRASFLWKFIEEKSYSDYINDVITNELYAIKFLTLQFSTWSSGGKASAYELKDDKYKKYISDLELIEVINKSRLKKEFWNLDKKTIESSVAFILIKELSTKERLIEIENIENRIELWEKEFLSMS